MPLLTKNIVNRKYQPWYTYGSFILNFIVDRYQVTLTPTPLQARANRGSSRGKLPHNFAAVGATPQFSKKNRWMFFII